MSDRMLYLKRKPVSCLQNWVCLLWYVRAPASDHRRERILPSGCSHLVISLSRDFLLDCPDGSFAQKAAPALIVGQRSRYEIIDTSDFADLIGVLFAPGVLPALTADRADLFSNRSTPVAELWNGAERQLRQRLGELESPEERLDYLERFLVGRFVAVPSLHPAVGYALQRLENAPAILPVAQLASETGWSARRFSQLFREHIGFTPKAWYRLKRFQKAVQQLHHGIRTPLAELALHCGFYDQAHFANEFRAFSGMDATTYLASRHVSWANHARLD